MLLDILFLLLLVIFIFYRLFNVLGKHNELEKKSSSWESVFSSHLKKKAPTTRKKAYSSASIQEGEFQVTENGVKGGQVIIDQLKKMDDRFTVHSFLEGAQSAFELVLQAYACGDFSSIEAFVAPDVITSFATEVQKRGDRTYTVDIPELSAEIMDAHMTRTSITLEVKFLSEQKWSERDSTNPSYRHDEVLSCTDIWTFERPVKSNNPNWTLVATSEELSSSTEY